MTPIVDASKSNPLSAMAFVLSESDFDILVVNEVSFFIILDCCCTIFFNIVCSFSVIFVLELI